MAFIKLRDLKISATIILTTLGVLASAQLHEAPTVEKPDPTYLSSFGYRLTDVGGMDTVHEMYADLRNDLVNNPKNNCYERANVWAYQMLRNRQVQSGKIFLFYAYGPGGSWNFNGMGWWFHVAPYVVTEGNEVVMEKMFDVTTPLSMDAWLKKQSGGKICKELTGTETELLNQIPKNYSMPATHAPCYYRKAPMNYHHPIEIYNHDVKRRDSMNRLENMAYSSCYFTVGARNRRDRSAKCNRFLQNPNGPLSL